MAILVERKQSFVSFPVTLGEAVAIGDLVGLGNNGLGYLADADGTQGTSVADKALGFAAKVGTTGDTIDIYPICYISGLVGLTVGAPYYLSATAGGISATKVSTNGNTHQVVGIARSATMLCGNVQAPLKFQTAGNSTLTSY